MSLFNPLFSTRVSTDAIGLFTGQIGWAWDAALLYVKGGAAVTNNNVSILTTLGEVELGSASSTRWGATVGAGLEWGFAPNWSVASPCGTTPVGLPAAATRQGTLCNNASC